MFRRQPSGKRAASFTARLSAFVSQPIGLSLLEPRSCQFAGNAFATVKLSDAASDLLVDRLFVLCQPFRFSVLRRESIVNHFLNAPKNTAVQPFLDLLTSLHLPYMLASYRGACNGNNLEES